MVVRRGWSGLCFGSASWALAVRRGAASLEMRGLGLVMVYTLMRRRFPRVHRPYLWSTPRCLAADVQVYVHMVLA